MGNSSQTRVKMKITKTVTLIFSGEIRKGQRWKWPEAEKKLEWQQTVTGWEGERAKHWVGDSRWPMTWTDKPTSSTSTLPTSFFLHWRKSRQILFWEIQITNIEFTETTTITTAKNVCERLYLSCILHIIYAHHFYFWHRTGQGLLLKNKNRLDNKRWCSLSTKH